VLDHVTIRASDRAASERFYETVLATLGIEKTHACAEFAEWDDFSVAAASADRPATRRLHIGFAAPSRTHVDDFWRTGTAAGYRDDGAPGARPQYSQDYYGSFLLDPDANSAEAVHHGSVRANGIVDHLWIRVADLAASRRFYERIAPHAGLRMGRDTPQRVSFASDGGVFSLLPGEPTEHVQLAFGARDQESVDAFQAAALAAGYESSGGVLDPSGFIVELIAPGRAPG
jgi:catechol 2,3-dioxygenase-like lactoylglutathione lyase family enzyme